MAHSLSVIIPCKNERTNIKACIESARPVAAEIIVADSGSTDGTLELVRQMDNCRLIQRQYRTSGDFKNWAIPQAWHRWLLILDADERITPPLACEIRRLLRTDPEQDGYWIYRNNHLMGQRVRHTNWNRDKVLRLFRRDLGHYQGPSDHGEVAIATDRVGTLACRIDHYTVWSWGQWLQKVDRYSHLQARQWYAAGRRPSLVRMLAHPPLRFARDYIVYRGFLDGLVGLQISWSSAFYSFMKQARLWELHRSSDSAGGADSSL
jgi:glycosyltransferase involved in cell wall biosynthesis